jgi:hypothetical protein
MSSSMLGDTMEQFSNSDYWKAIVLYGLNTATYKMALAHCLLDFAKDGQGTVDWIDLSAAFYLQYRNRLNENPMPQQGMAGRLTKLERIVRQETQGHVTHDEAIEKVAIEGFEDVVPRFQTIGRNAKLAGGKFYDYDFGKQIMLKDSLLELGETSLAELKTEIDARWNLLEGAFSINQSQQDYQLANDVRDIYLISGYDRMPLTQNIPFLTGYQGNGCFYCGEKLGDDIHVDHVLPRQVISHDEVWNLVLSHGHCNALKSDKLVGPHYIEKLIARNENIMGSNHPWKRKIETGLGKTPGARTTALRHHYDQVRIARGLDYWGGTAGYNPESDPFYRRLVTMLNNK